MIADIELGKLLTERLTEIETASKDSLLMALPHEKYLVSCGYLECLRQVRDSLIPQMIEDLQNK